MLARLLREPLLHFLLLGGVLFAVFGRGGSNAGVDDRQIVVSEADIDRLAAGFSRTWHRSPASDELQAQIQDYIREEVLYRTALALGLDKDDTIIRRRLRQKMEFLFEDTVPQPQEPELRAYFQAHAEKFRTQPLISFRQIFVTIRRGGTAETDARQILARLVAVTPGAADEGDTLLLGEGFSLTPLDRIAELFGEDFAHALAQTAPGSWVGPLPSAYGLHLVLVTAAEPAALLPFEQVRKAVLAALLLPVQGLCAHEVRPGFLELRETAANVFLMTWKVPALGAFRLGIEPRLPGFCHVVGEPTSMQAGGAFIEHGRVNCDRSLQGQTIAIDRLDATLTDVLVRIESADGSVRSARLTPSNPSFIVPVQPSPLMVLRAYVGLGVEHILFGIDHLLFVLCLLLLVRGLRKLLATVTAFTLAHSITLAAATLGFIRVPSVPVEATIALSIVFLASELVRGEAGRGAVTRSYPWLIAFSFGLLHGLGFAGALAEVGLPQGEIPLALFAFNVGVELGQLAFVSAVLSLARLARVVRLRLPAWAPGAAGYAIGSVAAFWVFARLATAA